MVEIVGVVSAIAGLVRVTVLVLDSTRAFVNKTKQTDEVIDRIRSKVRFWQGHLEDLSDLQQKDDSIDRTSQVLLDNGILAKSQQCLERLAEIVAEATPSNESKKMDLWDRVHWRFSRLEEVNSLLDKLGHYQDEIQSAVQRKNTDKIGKMAISVSAMAEALQVKISHQEALEVLSWLEPDSGSMASELLSIHFEKQELREKGTCEWMTESILWRDWSNGGSDAPDRCRRFLWIHGLPGTGKTILASYLIENLNGCRSKIGFSYYYCLHQRRRDETVSFLRWVIRDLCRQLGNFIPSRLRGMFQCNQLTVDDLKECLRVVVQEFQRPDGPQRKRVFIIVDAVDESKAPRDKFLSVLTALGADPAFAALSLLMTSRPYADIKEAIDDLPPIEHPRAPSGPLVIRPQLLSQYQSETSHQVEMEPPERLSEHQGDRTLSESNRADDGTWMPQFPPAATDHMLQTAITPSTGSSLRKRPSSRAHEGRPPSPRKRKNSEGGSHVDVDSPCTPLPMDNNFVLEAIEIYIVKKLKNSKRFGDWPQPDFLGHLKTQLAAKASGIFRTVACHLDMIERHDLFDENEILRCIETMPDSIFETYEKILVEGLPDDGDLNRCNREIASTALALISSETSDIPDAGVLLQASRSSVPQLTAQMYTRDKLSELLGCLAKISVPMKRPPPSVYKRDDDLENFRHCTIAHYTVKEYLYSEGIKKSPASFFALSNKANQKLELRVVFSGLQHFNPNSRTIPTRYEEYCLSMTEKALSQRPAIVAEEKEVWEVVVETLKHNAPHRNAVYRNRQITKKAFPRWYSLNAFEDEEIPKYAATGVLVNLILLDWPELAKVYLQQLSTTEKSKVWRDVFGLREEDSRTLIQLCVTRRRLDFLNIFVGAGARFKNEEDILFRALRNPYGLGNEKEDGTTTEKILKKLLDLGAVANPLGFKCTPLQVATHHLEKMWVQHLLVNKADPYAVGDPSGEDPFDSSEEDDREWYLLKPMEICSKDDGAESRRERCRVQQLLTQFGQNRNESSVVIELY